LKLKKEPYGSLGKNLLKAEERIFLMLRKTLSESEEIIRKFQKLRNEFSGSKGKTLL
jgi:hypothetical protein